MVRTLNLGILAHVDAGKTSLTERLLFAAGVIDEIGSVDDGSTQTDALALERQRGITIKSAVVSFVIDDVTVNLIDTPGHPDFIAEVERVLDVLDGAVLVVSVGGLGTRRAAFIPLAAGEPGGVSTLVEGLAEHDDGLLAAYVENDATINHPRLRVELAAQTKRAIVHPVFFGSAITGAGVDALTAGIAELLPAEPGDVDGPLSGTVFKIERGGAGERIAYAPVGPGAAVAIMDQDPNPYLATVGLRVDPAPIDTGAAFRLEVELGSMPSAFFKAVEETALQTLSKGGLHGWEVTDCMVTMTDSGYAARQSHSHAVFDKSMSSTAGDFRSLTPLVLMSALRKAGTTVYEPMHRFELELPADTLGRTLAVLARLRAVPDAPTMRGSACLLVGEIPAARVHELTQHLPALTRGEGVLESAFDRYQPVRGAIPTRPGRS